MESSRRNFLGAGLGVSAATLVGSGLVGGAVAASTEAESVSSGRWPDPIIAIVVGGPANGQIEVVDADDGNTRLAARLEGFPDGWIVREGDHVLAQPGADGEPVAIPLLETLTADGAELLAFVGLPGKTGEIGGRSFGAQRATLVEERLQAGITYVAWAMAVPEGNRSEILAIRALAA